MSASKQHRNNEVCDLYTTRRFSLRDLGRKFDLNHERIRQILRARGIPINPPFSHLAGRKSTRGQA